MDYIGWTAGLTARDESFEFRPHERHHARVEPALRGGGDEA